MALSFEDALARFQCANLTPVSDVLPEPAPEHASTTEFRKIKRRLGVELPALWKKVLCIRNGAYCVGKKEDSTLDLFIFPANMIASTTHNIRADAASLRWNFPKAWITVAHNVNDSDFVVLDTSKKTADGDSPLLQIIHEGGVAEERWKSIGSFLEYALGGRLNPYRF
jgi:hypothetical protein